MAWIPSVGDEAENPGFGRIVVLATDGKYVSYCFKDGPGNKYRCDARWLISNFKPVFRQTVQAPVPSTVIDEPASVPPLKNKKMYKQDVGDSDTNGRLYHHVDVGDTNALNAIDSLRFGLVPRDSLIGLSMFRNQLEKFYEDSLPYDDNKARPKFNLVSGAFGEGKSHTMAYVRERAIADGYLVASVEVNGKEVTLAKPESLVYSIFSNLAGNGLSKASPMVDLYRKAIQKKFDGPNITSFGRNRNGDNYELVRFIHTLGKVEEVDDLLEELLTCNIEITATQIRYSLAERLNLSTMSINLSRVIGNAVDERPIDLLAALISTALVARAAGYKGILITFDEWEVQTLASTRKDRERVEAVLRAIETFFTNEKIVKAPISFFVFNVPEESSEVSDLMRSVASKSNGCVYLVPKIESWEIESTEIRTMLTKIHGLYKQCYTCNGLSEEELLRMVDNNIDLIDFSESGAIRQITKLVVSTLDQHYSPPFVD